MEKYIIEFGENTLNKSFNNDGDAISFCQDIIDEYEFNGVMQILRERPYEDHLASGIYWSVVWVSIK
tara:strand:- start:34 stop:234 length:201 start_codon:yes stop_codon:yes gene_type:complete